MGKLVVSENVTLDGVVQDPTGDEGFRLGGWFGQISDKDREAWAKVQFDEELAAGALLMGRHTYEWLVPRWRSRSGDWADRLNSMPKYVVSSTLVDPEWNNSTVLDGDVATEAANLKQRVTGDVVVNGSRRLVHTLLAHDLVDELRLTIFPFALGAGERLFAETRGTRALRLVDTRTVGDGLAFLTYQLAGKA
jgi:dihydrofolate reductase